MKNIELRTSLPTKDLNYTLITTEMFSREDVMNIEVWNENDTIFGKSSVTLGSIFPIVLDLKDDSGKSVGSINLALQFSFQNSSFNPGGLETDDVFNIFFFN
jgi:hypothetical protein